MHALTVATPAVVRATIAAHMLGQDHAQRLGTIDLLPHQVDATRRLRRMLATGGALLADDVGLGKTYVALAVARHYTTRLVIGPAALRSSWAASSNAAAVPIEYMSMEQLSRGSVPDAQPDIIVIDEAHHFRTPATRRFVAVSQLAARTPVLLLTASPVQNRVADLRVLLSLFLGTTAHALSGDELARYVVRRDAAFIGTDALVHLPAVDAPRWLPALADVDCLDRIVALPPPVPPVDGESGGVLFTYTCVRQWASSRAALTAALRRRLARGFAMCDALRAGRLPSRTELAAWCHAEDAQQLTLTELLVDGVAADAAQLLSAVEKHVQATRGLLHWIDGTSDPDVERARILLDLGRQHAGRRIVAFSEYTETVARLYRLLSPSGGVAMLTHRGGRVAGGHVTRAEVIAQFAADASKHVAAASRIDLLLTTDVLSEGINLPDASVVVHLDLPWNPARVEQRVGRLRRLGSPHPSIAVWMFPPPTPTEKLLAIERRLRAKRLAAERTVGVAGTILPGLVAPPVATPVRHAERITAMLEGWRGDAATRPVATAVRASRDGVIACIRDGADAALACSADGMSFTDDRELVASFLACASGDAALLPEDDLQRVLSRLAHWVASRSVSRIVDLPTMHVAQSRRSMLHRVEAIARRTARHARIGLAPLMRAARTAATATLPIGAERVLDELSRTAMPDQAWLRAVGEFAALHAGRSEEPAIEVLAVLVLRKA